MQVSIHSRSVIVRVAVLIAACIGAALPASALSVARPAIGIAVTPRHFPQHSPQDLAAAYLLAKRDATYAVQIWQWSQLEERTARDALLQARASGLEPIVALSPLRLDGGRRDLDAPRDAARRAGVEPSFGDPRIADAYVEAARRLARLKPRYLCLGTEMNLLVLQRRDEFLHFVRAYKRAYRAAKSVAPDARVFVSFQWDWMREVDRREPARIAEHRKVIDALRPELDAIAFTSYPATFFDAPAKLPLDYYAASTAYLRPADRVLWMEIGWPSRGPGTEAEQAEFVARLPTLFTRTRADIVAWSLLHDVQLAEFGDDLATTGLYTRDGKPKPALAAFSKLWKR